MKRSCNLKYLVLGLMLGWSAISAPAQASWQEVFLNAGVGVNL